jgi:hypothetical protein
LKWYSPQHNPEVAERVGRAERDQDSSNKPAPKLLLLGPSGNRVCLDDLWDQTGAQTSRADLMEVIEWIVRPPLRHEPAHTKTEQKSVLPVRGWGSIDRHLGCNQEF